MTAGDTEVVNLWDRPDHAERFLARRTELPWREFAYQITVDHLPTGVARVLDLGTGDGALLAAVLEARPDAVGVGLDFSPSMLDRARERFADDGRVEIRHHDLDDPLRGNLGTFDAVVSAFAIHHCVDARKRALYAEVFALLDDGGMFANLEHVASPTRVLHEAFLARLGIASEDDDPSNKLCDVETQLAWLRVLGFTDVDCHLKWYEIALLAGRKP